MDREKIKLLFALLGSAIRCKDLTEEQRDMCSPELLAELLKVTAKHDLAHLLVSGMRHNGLKLQEEIDTGKYIFNAIYRYEQLKYEYENICNALEKAQIPFIPLKGSVIRKYYPEGWMRTSCDIDVLVSEADSEKAKSVLVDEYGYKYHEKGSHDISLFAPNKMHVELHYSLIEDGRVNSSSTVLKEVWDTAVNKEGFSYWKEMPDDMFYFFHIAHMAKHFETGGCGIRPLIDLWILDNIKGADHEKRNDILKRGNILKFADAARRLSKVWFDNAEADLISQQMEEYILTGGVYGTSENRITVQQQKKGGRFRYALSKIFIPYEIIKFQYPILQKHRWLTPIMEIRRWGKLIFCGHAKRSLKELKYNQNISEDKANSTKAFLTSIGLE